MLVWGGNTYSTVTGWTNFFNTGGRYDPATNSWTPMATGSPGAASPRSGHAAVWTGNEMLIWGGNASDPNGSDPLGTGARYNPATDSWASMSPEDAPSPRSSFTAVWTGHAMVVWGGGYYDPGGASHFFNTGARYDPVSDVWTPTSSLGAPSARQWQSAVWTGSKMVIWGGVDANFQALNSGGRYNPSTDTWTPTTITGAPSARAQHSAVWTGTKMIVWGGGYSSVPGTGGQYDPAADAWSPVSTAGAPTDRSSHSAVWTGTNMLVWGGEADPPPVEGGSYDPAANTWAPITPVGQPVGSHANSAVWTGSEMVVWGGNSAYPLDPLTDPRDTGGRYDPATDTWRSTTTVGAPSGRYGHSAIWTGSRMLVWGGGRDYVRLANGGSYLLDAVATDDCDGDGFTVAQGDCNDHDPGVHPGATETCNGIDDNCDGVVDENGSVLCDDRNPCTIDSCQPQGGCAHTPEPEYTSCDDGNICNGNEYCDVYGNCSSYYPPECGFYDPCLLQWCDPQVGCEYAPVGSPDEVVDFYADDKTTFSWPSNYPTTAFDVVRGDLAALPAGPGAGDEICFGNVSSQSISDASLPAPNEGYWYLIRGRNTCADPGTYGTQSDGTPRTTTTCP
jgi:N-acetylneuraminic acid mutarotase